MYFRFGLLILNLLPAFAIAQENSLIRVSADQIEYSGQGIQDSRTGVILSKGTMNRRTCPDVPKSIEAKSVQICGDSGWLIKFSLDEIYFIIFDSSRGIELRPDEHQNEKMELIYQRTLQLLEFIEEKEIPNTNPLLASENGLNVGASAPAVVSHAYFIFFIEIAIDTSEGRAASAGSILSITNNNDKEYVFGDHHASADRFPLSNLERHLEVQDVFELYQRVRWDKIDGPAYETERLARKTQFIKEDRWRFHIQKKEQIADLRKCEMEKKRTSLEVKKFWRDAIKDEKNANKQNSSQREE